MSAASLRLEEAAGAQQKSAGVTAKHRPFARPRFELEIDTTGDASYKPGHAQCETPLSRVHVAQRPWLSPSHVKALRAVRVQSGGTWTSMCRTQPASVWASAASASRADEYVETLVSPVLTYSESDVHVQVITDLVTQSKVAPYEPGGVRVRFSAQPMSRDMVLHAIRLNRHFHDTWVALFGKSPKGHVVDVQPLSKAFVTALVEHQLADKAGIAALYQAHQTPAHAFVIKPVTDDEQAVELHYLYATLDAETLSLFVDTCYAMLKVAHLAGPFEDHHWVDLSGHPKAKAEYFTEAVEHIDARLADRLRERLTKPMPLALPPKSQKQPVAEAPDDEVRSDATDSSTDPNSPAMRRKLLDELHRVLIKLLGAQEDPYEEAHNAQA